MADAYSNTNANGSLSWDDTITVDGAEFLVLPEGNYEFIVTGFERGQFPGSTKLPPCDKATLELLVTLNDGRSTAVRTDLILHSSLEWKIASFFRCMGLKKHGEAMGMPISKGFAQALNNKLKGVAHIKPRKYTDKNGNEREANEVDTFLEGNIQNVLNREPAKTAKPATQAQAAADDDDDLLG